MKSSRRDRGIVLSCCFLIVLLALGLPSALRAQPDPVVTVRADSLDMADPDSLAAAVDSLGAAARADSLRGPAPADSVPSVAGGVDSLRAPAAASVDTLRIYSNFWSLTGFKYQFGKYGGPIGFGAKEIKEIVKDHPKALAEAKKFKKNEIPSFLLTFIGGLNLLGGIIQQKIPAIGFGGAMLGAGIALDQKGNAHLKNSARIFNEERRARGATVAELPEVGDGNIRVFLKSGRVIEARSVAPNALGTIRVDPVDGKTEFHDATKILSIQNGLGWDVTSEVLEWGKTVTAP